MPSAFRHLAIASASLIFCVSALAQSGPEFTRPPAVIPVEDEPAPKLVPYPPLPEALARGVVIVQFRTENFRVIPVFGKNAVDVSPRIGHLHVTVDNWPGHLGPHQSGSRDCGWAKARHAQNSPRARRPQSQDPCKRNGRGHSPRESGCRTTWTLIPGSSYVNSQKLNASPAFRPLLRQAINSRLISSSLIARL